jgi:hypothetical protein
LPDQFDVDLVDHALLEELSLAADLMAAANQSDARLPLAEIDRILGLAGAVPGTDEHAPEQGDSGSEQGPTSPQSGQVHVPRPRRGADGDEQDTRH